MPGTERVAPMFYSAEDVANAREAVGSLWSLLRPALWHSTPPARYRAILDDGEIRPDGGHGGNVYKGSLAVSIGAVSLFDFESASEEDALGTFRKWCTHLWPPDIDTRVTVWVGLNRDRLPGRLMLAKEVGELATRERKNHYPRVEACHLGPVPVTAFTEVLAVSPYGFEWLPIGQAALPRMDQLVEQCPEGPEAKLVRIPPCRAGSGCSRRSVSMTHQPCSCRPRSARRRCPTRQPLPAVPSESAILLKSPPRTVSSYPGLPPGASVSPPSSASPDAPHLTHPSAPVAWRRASTASQWFRLLTHLLAGIQVMLSRSGDFRLMFISNVKIMASLISQDAD